MTSINEHIIEVGNIPVYSKYFREGAYNEEYLDNYNTIKFNPCIAPINIESYVDPSTGQTIMNKQYLGVYRKFRRYRNIDTRQYVNDPYINVNHPWFMGKREACGVAWQQIRDLNERDDDTVFFVWDMYPEIEEDRIRIIRSTDLIFKPELNVSQAEYDDPEHLLDADDVNKPFDYEGKFGVDARIMYLGLYKKMRLYIIISNIYLGSHKMAVRLCILNKAKTRLFISQVRLICHNVAQKTEKNWSFWEIEPKVDVDNLADITITMTYGVTTNGSCKEKDISKMGYHDILKFKASDVVSGARNEDVLCDTSMYTTVPSYFISKLECTFSCNDFYNESKQSLEHMNFMHFSSTAPSLLYRKSEQDEKLYFAMGHWKFDYINFYKYYIQKNKQLPSYMNNNIINDILIRYGTATSDQFFHWRFIYGYYWYFYTDNGVIYSVSDLYTITNEDNPYSICFISGLAWYESEVFSNTRNQAIVTYGDYDTFCRYFTCDVDKMFRDSYHLLNAYIESEQRYDENKIDERIFNMRLYDYLISYPPNN